MCEPRAIFVERIIARSVSKEFDLAMTEWGIIGKLFRFEQGFEINCQLCGAALTKMNFVIQNVKNNNRYYIGSECKKRFSDGHIKYNEIHSNQILRLRRKYKIEKLKVRAIDRYNLICNQGYPNDVNFEEFRTVLLEVLRLSKGTELLESSEGARKILVKILNKPHFHPKEIIRLKLILKNPNKARKIFILDPRKTKKIDKYGLIID